MAEDKVLAVVSTILQNPDLISEVFSSDDEYYFRCKGHAMSVLHRGADNPFGAYSFYVYPSWSGSLDRLAELLSSGNADDVGVKMASYHARDYDESALRRLYQLLENRDLNVDSVFDDILSD